VSGASDEESSRRRLLALLAAALLALLGAGTGFFGDDDDGDDEDGVDLSVDYDVTPDEPVPSPTPTPTPTPGSGESGADGTTDPPERPDGTAGTGADDSSSSTLPRRDDPGDESDNPNANPPSPTGTPGGELVATSIPPVSVADVEPGDGGTVDLSLTLSGSPARLWVRGDVTAVDEGGTTEAERSAGDAGGAGELQEYVRVQLWYDADGDGAVSGGERGVYEGTLAELDARDGWVALTGTCVAPGTHTARFRWDLPADAPNVVQTDGVSFSLGVAADTSGCA
jgi:hypothetical protein